MDSTLVSAVAPASLDLIHLHPLAPTRSRPADRLDRLSDPLRFGAETVSDHAFGADDMPFRVTRLWDQRL